MVLTSIAFVYWLNVNAQSSLEAVLWSIEKNNPSLVADRQFWEFQRLEYKTGLTLPNPTVQGQYLFGSPSTAGDQTDFFVVQPFDFPKTYKKPRELAEEQGTLSTSSIAARGLEVLLEGKSFCLEMVYRKQLKTQFEGRKTDL